MGVIDNIRRWWRGPEAGDRQVYFGSVRKDLRSNRVSTCKYTLISFLPIFLYEQFSNVVYIIFLINLVVQVRNLGIVHGYLLGLDLLGLAVLGYLGDLI